MRILVTYATRHGGTEGIAHAVAAALVEGEPPGPVVEVLPVSDVEEVGDFDAVIIGSAVYNGRWLRSARAFVGRHAKPLRRRQVWLFSSGPVGDPAVPADDALDAPRLADLVAARDVRTFPGCLRSAELSRAEHRAISSADVADGDYRDWTEIRNWALEISDILAPATRL